VASDTAETENPRAHQAPGEAAASPAREEDLEDEAAPTADGISHQDEAQPTESSDIREGSSGGRRGLRDAASRTRTAWGKLGTPSEAFALSARLVKEAEDEDRRRTVEAERAADQASRDAAVGRLHAIEQRQHRQNLMMEDALWVNVHISYTPICGRLLMYYVRTRGSNPGCTIYDEDRG
jgi:hypothetical protein